MDYLLIHPGFQDHTRERDLARGVTVPANDQPIEQPIQNDSEFVAELIEAVRSNQVQLAPRAGSSSAYIRLIEHLGNRAKDVA